MTGADMRDTVLVSLGCLVAAIAVLAMPVLGVPLCAMALAWLTYRRGTFITAVVIVAATAVAASQGVVEGLLTAGVLIAVGPVAARMLRERSPWSVVGAIALAVLAATLAAYAAEAAAQHTDVLGLMQASMNELMAAIKAAAERSAPPGQVAAVLQNAREGLYQWPAWLVVESVLSGLLATYAVGRQARRAGIEDVRELPSLDRLDLSWHLTWGLIAGFALMAVARFTHQPDGATGILGLNVMRVTGSLLAIQGLAVFAGLYRKAGMGRIARSVGYVFLAITEPLTAVFVPVGLVGLTGLIDLFVNLRKLPRGGDPQPAEELDPPVGDE